MIQCGLINPNLDPNTYALRSAIIEKSNDGTIDFEHLAKPGNLVKVVIKKKLENGLLVSFLKMYYGFIFQDLLDQDLKQYDIGKKIFARIIATNFEKKQIHLSLLPFHLSLQTYIPEKVIGQTYTQGTIKKVLYGASYIVTISENQVQIKDPNVTNNKKDKKNKESILEETKTFEVFLHKIQINNPENEEKTYHKGEIIEGNLMIKDFNYFTHNTNITMRSDNIGSQNIHWHNIKVK